MVELMHTKGGDFQAALEKLYRQVKGEEYCPIGDLRFLWPFLDPSHDAHMQRYHLDKQIKETAAGMPTNPMPPRGQPAWLSKMSESSSAGHPYGGGEGSDPRQ